LTTNSRQKKPKGAVGPPKAVNPSVRKAINTSGTEEPGERSRSAEARKDVITEVFQLRYIKFCSHAEHMVNIR